MARSQSAFQPEIRGASGPKLREAFPAGKLRPGKPRAPILLVEERNENQGNGRHQLDEDVDGRAGGVL